MYKYLYILLTLSILTGCKDDISLSSMSDQPKLVVYCMPSTADTTYIFVTQSLPVQHLNNRKYRSNAPDAHIVYTVNGVPQTVEHVALADYRVVAKQRAGDKITLQVSAPGLEPVHAETTIPDNVPMLEIKSKEVQLASNIYFGKATYTGLAVTFTDPNTGPNYYALRVIGRFYSGQVLGYYGSRHRRIFRNYGEYLKTKDEYRFDSVSIVYEDSVSSVMEINAQQEPLLHPISKIDDSFGYDAAMYQQLYIFDNKQIRGKTYTLHLNVNKEDSYLRGLSYEMNFAQKYSVELYRISPVYYHYLQSINTSENNPFSEPGMTSVTPIPTNILGGYGLLGAFAVTHTPFVMGYD